MKNGTRKNRQGKMHQLRQWRQSEPDHDKVHLSDEWRVRMGIQVPSAQALCRGAGEVWYLEKVSFGNKME